MEGSQLVNGRATCDCGFFSLLVQTLPTHLHLATHVHLPSLDFFLPTELRKEKSNSRNVRRKISLRSEDTWPMLKVVGKRTLRLANVSEYLVRSKRVLRANNGAGTSIQILEKGWHL